MSDKLKSRKFWFSISAAVSVFIAEYFGIEISPEALTALAGIVLSYNFGQGWVDKTVAKAEIEGAADFTKQNAIAYARQLEAELAKVNSDG